MAALWLSACSSLVGQEPPKYPALKQELGLTDAQIAAIDKEAWRNWEDPRQRPPEATFRPRALNAEQKAKLTELVKLLKFRTIYGAVLTGVIQKEQLPVNVCGGGRQWWEGMFTPDQVDEMNIQLYRQNQLSPTREQLWALLTPEQRVKIEAFKKYLPVLTEGIQLGLILLPSSFADVDCH
jgi:hypothetical protein